VAGAVSLRTDGVGVAHGDVRGDAAAAPKSVSGRRVEDFFDAKLRGTCILRDDVAAPFLTVATRKEIFTSFLAR
jgi:hypothetical protein